MIDITIPGQPVAKGRPRVTKWGTYTPEKTVSYENLVQFSFLEKYRKSKPLEGPLIANISLYFSIPVRTSKKNRELMLLGQIRPTKKPDIDNCMKAITDALNGFAYKDDSQIIEVSVGKFYSDEPRVYIKIEGMKI